MAGLYNTGNDTESQNEAMRTNNHTTVVLALWGLSCIPLYAQSGAMDRPVEPFERPVLTVDGNKIDKPIVAALRAKGIEPAYPCSDAVFIRRVSLDLHGAPASVRTPIPG